MVSGEGLVRVRACSRALPSTQLNTAVQDPDGAGTQQAAVGVPSEGRALVGTTVENQPPVVSIGIDAAVVAPHQVAIRGPGVAEDFRVRPTLARLEELTVRLADWAPAMVVAEPTAGTWLPLLHAVSESGCRSPCPLMSTRLDSPVLPCRYDTTWASNHALQR